MIDLILIYYNNIITIYKVEYNSGKVKLYSTLKRYHITEPVILEESVRSFIIVTSNRRLVFSKYNKFPIEKDRCYKASYPRRKMILMQSKWYQELSK